MMIWDAIEKYWFVIVGAIFPVYWYAMKATFATKAELDVEKRRTTKLETTVDALPSSKEFNALSKEMLVISGDIKGINADMAHIKKNLDLLVQTEMKRGDK